MKFQCDGHPILGYLYDERFILSMDDQLQIVYFISPDQFPLLWSWLLISSCDGRSTLILVQFISYLIMMDDSSLAKAVHVER